MRAMSMANGAPRADYQDAKAEKRWLKNETKDFLSLSLSLSLATRIAHADSHGAR